MENLPFSNGAIAKELATPDALAMAEVALIHNDLNTCIRSLRLIKQRYLAESGSDEDRDIKMALFRDAITLYVSAFVGTGYKLKAQTVYEGIEGFTEFFQWARDVRDAYAAHTFGPARQCVTVLAVDPRSGLSMGVGPFRLAWDFVNLEAVDELGKAATIAAKFAEGLGRQLNERLVAEAGKLTEIEIASLTDARLHVPDPTELRMTRERFRKSKSDE